MPATRLVVGCTVVTALALLCSDGAVSQTKKAKDDTAKLPYGWSHLNLTAKQTEQVLKLQAEHKEAVDKLKRQIAVLDADLVKNRLGVLTDEQRKKLRESYADDGVKKEKDKR